jgi:signal transduction histidine kinase
VASAPPEAGLSSPVAEDALDLAAPGITRLGLRVEAELSPAETTGDQQLIERMIWNLVDNAVRHNEPGCWIRVTTGTCGQGVVLRIAAPPGPRRRGLLPAHRPTTTDLFSR